MWWPQKIPLLGEAEVVPQKLRERRKRKPVIEIN